MTVENANGVTVRLWAADFRFRFSFRHNLADRRHAATILAAATLGDCVGWGQALPRDYLTGESLESVQADAGGWLGDALAAIPLADAPDLAAALAMLAPLHRRADRRRRLAAYAMLETAALDAVARKLGVPLVPPGRELPGTLPLVGVVPAWGPRKTAWLARAFKIMGYRRFKVKVGQDADADAARLATLRRVIGPDAWLAADANQAWSRDEALRRAEVLRRHGVSLIEEPLPPEAGRGCDFAALERELDLAVMADESLCTVADAEALLAGGSPSWWNLRLGKNGGFLGVAALAELARARGIHVYGGVLVGETSQLAAAGRAALFAAEAECLEYGFPRVFLKGDPFRGGPGGFTGVAAPPPHRPGLGTAIRMASLARVGRHLSMPEHLP